MSEVTKAIRAKGHWEIVVRPDDCIEGRIPNIMDLAPLVEKAAIHVTGWPYPVCKVGSSVRLGTDWAEYGGLFDSHNEIWRMHQSGQFVHYLGFLYDWREPARDERHPPSGRVLGALEVARIHSHVFRFAARLTNDKTFDGPLAIAITAHDLENRQLFMEAPERGEFHVPHAASIGNFHFGAVVESSDLRSNCDNLAAESAIELFRRFGWDPSQKIVLSMMPPSPRH